MKGTITAGDRRFGEAVRAAREEFNLSQREAAREIGINQTALYHIECCRWAPRLSTGVKVAAYFGIDLPDVFEESA